MVNILSFESGSLHPSPPSKVGSLILIIPGIFNRNLSGPRGWMSAYNCGHDGRCSFGLDHIHNFTDNIRQLMAKFLPWISRRAARFKMPSPQKSIALLL